MTREALSVKYIIAINDLKTSIPQDMGDVFGSPIVTV